MESFQFLFFYKNLSDIDEILTHEINEKSFVSVRWVEVQLNSFLSVAFSIQWPALILEIFLSAHLWLKK